MKKYILEDFLKIYDEASYVNYHEDVRKAINKKSFISGKEHFIKHGYDEIELGKRRLYEGLPTFNEELYILRFPAVKDMIARKEFLSPFHHYLMIGHKEILENQEIERLLEINTFSYKPIFIDFATDLLKGLPQARYIKIVFASSVNIEIKKIKVFATNYNQSLTTRKKIHSDNELVVLNMRDSSNIQIKSSKSPVITIDLEDIYELNSFEFEIDGVNIGMKSNFTISVSEDNKIWNNVFLTTEELSLRRIQSKLLNISYFLHSCQANQIEIMSFRRINNQEFKHDLLCKSFSEITKSLIWLIKNGISVRNSKVIRFAPNDLKVLGELKKKLQADFDKLPQSLEFTTDKDRHFDMLLKSFQQDEIILALPKKIEEKDIDIELFNDENSVEYKITKVSFSESIHDVCRNLLISYEESDVYNYSFWRLELSTFNKFRFNNLGSKVSLSHAWYILGVKKPYSEIIIVYRHGDVVKIYRELLLMMNIFLERNLNDLAQIMITHLLEGSFVKLFKLARNYQLDSEPFSVEIENLHQYVELVSSSNILSGRKIFTRHGIQKSLFDKNPKRLAQRMKDVEIIFSDILGYQCIAFYGTLLGIVRDKDFIAHDDDVDMLYLGDANSFEEMLIERQIIIDKLKEHGFKIMNVFEGGDYNIHLNVNGQLMDIFTSYKNKEKEYCFFASGKIVSTKITSFLPLKEVEFYNQILKIPNRPEDILAVRYGENWNVPDKNFGFVRKVNNNKYFLL